MSQESVMAITILPRRDAAAPKERGTETRERTKFAFTIQRREAIMAAN